LISNGILFAHETISSLLIFFEEKGHAYESNGSVYFRVKSFPEYGKIANKNFDDMIEGDSTIILNRMRLLFDQTSLHELLGLARVASLDSKRWK
jgi:hypothetical protein